MLKSTCIDYDGSETRVPDAQVGLKVGFIGGDAFARRLEFVGKDPIGLLYTQSFKELVLMAGLPIHGVIDADDDVPDIRVHVERGKLTIELFGPED